MSGTVMTVTHSAIAREMRDLAQRIESLAVTLGSDPAIARSHGTLLQECDELAQIQVALARIIEIDDSALHVIGLDALAGRLAAA
jgi:hypothetical protein